MLSFVKYRHYFFPSSVSSHHKTISTIFLGACSALFNCVHIAVGRRDVTITSNSGGSASVLPLLSRVIHRFVAINTDEVCLQKNS